jgi:uncharacterized protein with PIN domain
VLPREITAAKQSRRKDSNAKKAEQNIIADRLLISREYALLKRIALSIASEYRSAPGTTPEEDYSYQIYCKALYFYNKMFSRVEEMAKAQKRREQKDGDSGW